MKIHCKHICKCHNETPVQLIYANKKGGTERSISHLFKNWGPHIRHLTSNFGDLKVTPLRIQTA
jgi:hypothetical protein